MKLITYSFSLHGYWKLRIYNVKISISVFTFPFPVFYSFSSDFFCFTDGGGTSVIHTPSHKAPSMVRHFFHTINLFSKCFIHFLLEFTECVVFVWRRTSLFSILVWVCVYDFHLKGEIHWSYLRPGFLLTIHWRNNAKNQWVVSCCGDVRIGAKYSSRPRPDRFESDGLHLVINAIRLESTTIRESSIDHDSRIDQAPTTNMTRLAQTASELMKKNFFFFARPRFNAIITIPRDLLDHTRRPWRVLPSTFY